MHKKLLAVAVAGALAAPMLAQAASSGSTVQIYGVAEIEHGYIDQGNGRPSTDYVESTGSYLGFKGTESLGGGMSAWFQCETTMDIRAFDQVGLCSRNSGLGFRGGFGNVWIGRWHTPMSRALSLGSIGVEETGNLGFSALVTGGTGSVSAAAGLGATGVGTTYTNPGGSASRHRFRRRETCLTTYETPRMGGFMLGAAVSCGNTAAEAAATNQSNTKPRVWSFAGTYVNGPLAASLSYERHNEMGAFAAGARELDDRAWGLSAAYTFEQIDGELKKKALQIGVEWTISGPHALTAAYAWQDDTKGNSATAINETSLGGIAAAGPDTGADAFTIGYVYSFSKRTSAKLGYTRLDNDAQSRSARLHTAASVLNRGDNQDVVALVLKHRF
jgi:predicted porin